MTLMDRFDQFWQAYPVKKDKGHARKTFERLKVTDELLQTMLAAIARQKRSPDWLKEQGKYIPYPGTWLNGERWEDELTVKMGFCQETVYKCYECGKFRRESEVKRHPQLISERICKEHV